MRVALVLAAFSSTLAGAIWLQCSPPVREAAPPAATFYKDVLPILQDHCQNCHRTGEIAPMPLVTYDQTRPWASAIAHATQTRMMPPWFADPRFGHFSNDPSLTDEQIALLSTWAMNGTP